MPIPTPIPNESKAQFIERCMGNAVMVKEYPRADQRRAVCESAWDKKNAALIEWANRRNMSPCEVLELLRG